MDFEAMSLFMKSLSLKLPEFEVILLFEKLLKKIPEF